MTDHLRNTTLAAFCVLAANSSTADASFRVIYNARLFSPYALTEVAPGVFYIYTSPPEAISSVTTQGVLTPLASFTSPPYTIQSFPGVAAANGRFYSSVNHAPPNGNFVGNVFSVGSTAGSAQVYPTESFTPSIATNLPDGTLFGLVYDSLGNRYLGTTDSRGNVTTFYQFSVNDDPGPPIYGSDGNYYGVSGNRVVSETTSYFYQVTPSGSFTQVATLPFYITITGPPLVLEGTDGNIYGVRPIGLGGCDPSNQRGGIYRLTPSGQFTLLHEFGGCYGGIVDSLIEGSDGTLYGAMDSGVFFSLTKSGVYTAVYSLMPPDGACTCMLTQGSDGIIYGVAFTGGATGGGTVFALDLGLSVPKPRAQHFHPGSGPAGTQVLIWGYNLLKSSAQFNGVPAPAVRNAGPNYVWVEVPAGATTGPITVTTPGGSVTTQASFTVP
jgi:uncharacterized repeat protein (TIGR03803 family)